MATVKLLLRTRSVDEHGQTICPTPDEVDLDRLSPRARALAEAVAASPGQTAGEVWVESDLPIREVIPDWQTWYGEQGADRRLRQPWSGWDATFPAGSEVDPHWWLERQAAKIPAGWHVLGATPASPVPTQEHGLTVQQVVATAAHYKVWVKESTWRGYVSRGHAPKPVRRVGSTPLWDPGDVLVWLKSRPGQGARTDLT